MIIQSFDYNLLGYLSPLYTYLLLVGLEKVWETSTLNGVKNKRLYILKRGKNNNRLLQGLQNPGFMSFA